MPEHKIGTREEWQAARDELAKLEAEQAERNEEIKKRRLDLPWVPVEKEYEFDTEDGKKTLAELFDGRSQLLAYNIMFGPDYTLGACPGCTNLGDGLDGSLVHLNHRDVTLLCFSRAPIERLTAYKQRMCWQFPYVSTYNSDFAFDFGLAMTEEQAQQIPQVKEMIDNPPDWLQEWSRQIGAELKDGLREGPSWIAFARENGTVYHTYTVMAPDPFVAPYYSFLLERTPKAPTSRAPHLAERRVPGLTPIGNGSRLITRRCRREGSELGIAPRNAIDTQNPPAPPGGRRLPLGGVVASTLLSTPGEITRRSGPVPLLPATAGTLHPRSLGSREPTYAERATSSRVET